MGKRQQHSSLFVYAALLFVACLLCSNIAAFKLITLFGDITITGSVFLFVITYILNDVVAEVYGYEAAKKIIWAGFALNAFVALYFQFTIALPSPAYFQGSEAYATVLGNTPRMLVASLSAYLVGSFMNAKIMVRMKAWRTEKLFARCILSTFAGECADSVIFVLVAFAGAYDARTIAVMIATQAIFKTVYEIVAFPLTRVVIRKIKLHEGVA